MGQGSGGPAGALNQSLDHEKNWVAFFTVLNSQRLFSFIHPVRGDYFHQSTFQ